MRVFVQYGPDGKLVDKLEVKDDEETLALYDWIYSMRNRGYIGPFLLQGMWTKIKKEQPWKKSKKVVTIV